MENKGKFNKGKFREYIWLQTHGCAYADYRFPYFQIIPDAETLNKATALQGLQQHLW